MNTTMSFKSLMMALAAVAMLAFVGCGDNKKHSDDKKKQDSIRTADSLKKVQDSLAKIEAEKNASKPLAEALTAAGLTTLVELIKTAELEATVAGGQFTVFAPSEEAFKEFKGLDNLKKDKKKLGDALKNHLVEGVKKAADLKDGDKLKTVGGKELKVAVKEDKVTVNGVEVTAPDGAAANGVIHVVKKVIL
jgi:uncharacterized surface protein with fasciclin (FAS1) repeats